MSEERVELVWELLDWENGATVRPLPVSGFMLHLHGVAPHPVIVKLVPMPIGIVPEDYVGVEVRGYAEDPTVQVETPWEVHVETSKLPHGKVGFVLKGATKTEYVPPKDD